MRPHLSETAFPSVGWSPGNACVKIAEIRLFVGTELVRSEDEGTWRKK